MVLQLSVLLAQENKQNTNPASTSLGYNLRGTVTALVITKIRRRDTKATTDFKHTDMKLRDH